MNYLHRTGRLESRQNERGFVRTYLFIYVYRYAVSPAAVVQLKCCSHGRLSSNFSPTFVGLKSLPRLFSALKSWVIRQHFFFIYFCSFFLDFFSSIIHISGRKKPSHNKSRGNSLDISAPPTSFKNPDKIRSHTEAMKGLTFLMTGRMFLNSTSAYLLALIFSADIEQTVNLSKLVCKNITRWHLRGKHTIQ